MPTQKQVSRGMHDNGHTVWDANCPFCHWSAPLTSLHGDHADFTQDPQVNSLAAQEPLPSLSPLTTTNVVIQDLDDEKVDDNK